MKKRIQHDRALHAPEPPHHNPPQCPMCLFREPEQLWSLIEHLVHAHNAGPESSADTAIRAMLKANPHLVDQVIAQRAEAAP